MLKIRKNDLVRVLAGRSKGVIATVDKVVRRNNKYFAYVNGANMAYHYVRNNPQANQVGGIEKREAPIDLSNLMLVNLETNKAERVGFKIVDGKKVRYFKRSGNLVGNNNA